MWRKGAATIVSRGLPLPPHTAAYRPLPSTASYRRLPPLTAPLVGESCLHFRGCSAGLRESSLQPLGAVAQLGERLDRTQEVRGSSPLSSILQAVGCRLSAFS